MGDPSRGDGEYEGKGEKKKGPTFLFFFIFDLLVFPGDVSIAESHLGSFGGLSKTQTSKINLFFFVLLPLLVLLLPLFHTCLPLDRLFYLKICISQHSIRVHLKEHM